MTIWTFPLVISEEQTITIPRDARILSVQVQRDDVYLWAAVMPKSPPVQRVIHMLGTGQPLGQADSMQYLGTVQNGGDWHVFDGGEVT